MRLGIFGGSFDPVHVGHLSLASCAAEQANLDEVWFLPAAHQPLKQGGPAASGEDRAAMIELSIEDESAFALCRCDLDRGGKSYTWKTLEELSELRQDALLFWILGADALKDFPRWRKPERVCELATLLIAARGDSLAKIPEKVAAVTSVLGCEVCYLPIDLPPMPISSTDIRSRLAKGKSTDKILHPKVAKYIRKKGLYT